MLVPSLADRLLAKSGKASETSNQPSDPERSDNLFEAGPGDPGAHGRFDNKSSLRAFPFNPAWLRAGLACAGVATAAAVATLVAAYVADSRVKHRLASLRREDGPSGLPIRSHQRGLGVHRNGTFKRQNRRQS
jgi:hypothetical protein